MSRILTPLSIAIGLLTLGLLPAAPLSAQPVEAQHQQVVSANPFGLLLEFFNAEYERHAGAYSTAGVGGSYLARRHEDYYNADVFWRYYPQGRPLEGWAFGVKAGVTRSDSDTRFGAGFDVNHSWLLGPEDRFYVGAGFGLKRLLGSSDRDFGLTYVPTIRIINVGMAF